MLYEYTILYFSARQMIGIYASPLQTSTNNITTKIMHGLLLDNIYSITLQIHLGLLFVTWQLYILHFGELWNFLQRGYIILCPL